MIVLWIQNAIIYFQISQNSIIYWRLTYLQLFTATKTKYASNDFLKTSKTIN